MNRLGFVFFLSIAMGVLSLVCAGVAHLLTRILGGSSSFFWIGTGLLVSIALFYVAGEFYARKTHRYTLKKIGAIGLGSLSIFISITYLGYIPFWLGLSKDMLWMGIIGSTGLLIGWALFNHMRHPQLTRISLTTSKPILSPIRIVQLSDIHLNGLKSLASSQQIVDQVNSVGPDFIVFTGDLLDIGFEEARAHLLILSTLQAKIAKLGVSGNHDFYAHYPHFKKALSLMDFDLLDNKTQSYGPIQFIGLPDKTGTRFRHINRELPSHIEDTVKRFTVLLDHQPGAFKKTSKSRIDLQLSGHTHWGQLPPWGLLVRLRYRYSHGFYKTQDSSLYVSKGTSTWGPPMRLYGPSEIVVIDISPMQILS